MAYLPQPPLLFHAHLSVYPPCVTENKLRARHGDWCLWDAPSFVGLVTGLRFSILSESACWWPEHKFILAPTEMTMQLLVRIYDNVGYRGPDHILKRGSEDEVGGSLRLRISVSGMGYTAWTGQRTRQLQQPHFSQFPLILVINWLLL